MSESSEHMDGMDRAKRGRMFFVVVLGAAVAAAVVVGAIQLSGGENAAGPGGDSTSSPAAPAPEDTDASPTPAEAGANGGVVNPTLKPTGDILPEDLAGQEAIDALGDDIVLVAERSGKTVEELKELLLRDQTVRVSTDGFLYYVDPSHG